MAPSDTAFSPANVLALEGALASGELDGAEDVTADEPEERRVSVMGPQSEAAGFVCMCSVRRAVYHQPHLLRFTRRMVVDRQSSKKRPEVSAFAMHARASTRQIASFMVLERCETTGFGMVRRFKL